MSDDFLAVAARPNSSYARNFLAYWASFRGAEPMATVLCTGTERVLMETRALILRKSGHTVVTTMNEKELIEACSGHSFDVAVIGQGISRVQKKRVYDLLQQCCPAVKILELYSPTKGRALEQADSWLEVPAEVPDDLAAHVERLAASGRRAKSE